MKLYVVYRWDREDGQSEQIRAATRPLHRTYMDQFSAKVRLGGPVLNEQGQPCGGLMVIEAESLQSVKDMVSNDPFELAGLSKQIEIQEFRWQTRRPDDLPPL